MEHRLSNRTERNYFVVIFQAGQAVAIGKTKNMGKYGAFVQTDFHAPPREMLEIQFVPKGHKFLPKYRVKAQVVHQNSDGWGVEVNRESA